MVCDKQINLNPAADAALCPFTAETFRVKEFVQKHNLKTGYACTYGFSRHTLFLLVCMRVRFGPLLIYNKAKRGLWSLICLISFPNTCFSTCFVMSFAVQLLSDFVITPYVYRQRHGIRVFPPPVTCVVLMMFNMSSMSFSTAPIPT